MSERCSAIVRGGSGYRSWRGRNCSRPATVIRKVKESVKVAAAYIDNAGVYEGGEPVRVDARFEDQLVEHPFCPVHDPEAQRDRAAKKSEAARRERESHERINRRYYELRDAFRTLGLSANLDYNRDLGFCTGISFDSSECVKLLGKLGVKL